MIRNIVFDIGNVLIDFDPVSYTESLFDRDTAERVRNAVWGSGYWKELDIARYSEEDILAMFQGADPEISEEIRETFDRIGECVGGCSWVTPLVDRLRGKGYKVYYLSNMSEHVINSDPEAFAFTQHMDGGIYSCHVNTIKPSHEIYHLLEEKYDLIPEECLFIDDHPENIAAAKSLGWKGIVFTDQQQMQADLEQALTKDQGHDMITVVCYGDSNTYGYDPSNGSRYPYERRWTTILGRMLGEGYEVIPEGLNGRTTAYDRQGAAWKNGMSSLAAALGTHKPADYVIFMLGTNDCLSWLALSAEDIAGGMEELVDITEKISPELQGYVPEIIVTVPGAITDTAISGLPGEMDEYSVIKSREIAPLYREIADRHHCRYLDASASVTVSELDGIHLSEEGHKQLAILMRDAILNKGSFCNSLNRLHYGRTCQTDTQE